MARSTRPMVSSRIFWLKRSYSSAVELALPQRAVRLPLGAQEAVAHEVVLRDLLDVAVGVDEQVLFGLSHGSSVLLGAAITAVLIARFNATCLQSVAFAGSRSIAPRVFTSPAARSSMTRARNRRSAARRCSLVRPLARGSASAWTYLPTAALGFVRPSHRSPRTGHRTPLGSRQPHLPTPP